MHRVALAVAQVVLNHPPIFTLDDAFITHGAIPEAIARARASRLVKRSMRALKNALIAQLSAPSRLAVTRAVVPVEYAVCTTGIIAVVVNQKFARVTFGPHPRQDTLLANASLRVEVAAVLAVLRAVLSTVIPVIRHDTVVTDTVRTVQQATALARLVTKITSLSRKEAVAFARACSCIKLAVHTIQVALITLLSAPISVASARAVVAELTVFALGHVAGAFTCFGIEAASVFTPKRASIAGKAIPVALAI